MSQNSPQEAKKTRDGRDYIPRAKKLPKPEEAKDANEKDRLTNAQRLYEVIDGLFENGVFFIEEHDRLIYAVSVFHEGLEDDSKTENFLNIIKKADYLTWIKPFLDSCGVPQEAPIVDEVYDETDADSGYPEHKKWTGENPFYKGSGKAKPKYNKKDFVMQEAEEDNVASDMEDDARSVRSNQSQSDRRKAKDDKILAIAKSIVKSNPSMAKHKSNLCGCGEGRTITKGYNDGLCGPCRKKKNDKAKRRQLAEVKAVKKACEKKQKQMLELADAIKKKREMEEDIRKMEELTLDNDEESDSGLSDSDSDQ
jgi:hypothetical protein